MPQTSIHKWTLPEGTARPVVHTDMKALADQMDGQVPLVCTSTTRPPHVVGLVIFETDTKRTRQSNGTKWMLLSQPWTSFTPRLDGWGTSLGSGSKNTAEYCFSGDGLFTAQGTITFGTSGVSDPPNFPFISVGMPFTLAPMEDGNPAQAFGDGSHLYDGFGGGLRRIFLAGSSGGDGFQIFSNPSSGAYMASLSGAGYPFKAGTVITWRVQCKMTVPE